MTPLLAQRPRPGRGFERLYRRYVGDVYRYSLAVMRNEADAEDVTQTTFMNALRAFQRGERPEKPQNWLIAIAHNVCRQRFRQSARRPTEVAFEDDIGSQLVEPDDDTPTGEDIRRALGHLAFNQRAALVMRELEGRSYQEIGEILEVSVSAVETLIFRARRALREQLEEGITCHDAELAISRQLDGRLSRKDRGVLRAHLRECEECATFARSQRAQRGAIKSLAAIPLPTSLGSLFGGGGSAAVGTGLAFKAAAFGFGALLAGGVGYEGVRHTVWKPAAKHATAAAAATKSASNATTKSLQPSALGIDHRPFRQASIKARLGHHGRPAVSKVHPAHPAKGHGATAHRPAHARVHKVKPVRAHPPTHRGQTKTH